MSHRISSKDVLSQRLTRNVFTDLLWKTNIDTFIETKLYIEFTLFGDLFGLEF